MDDPHHSADTDAELDGDRLHSLAPATLGSDTFCDHFAGARPSEGLALSLSPAEDVRKNGHPKKQRCNLLYLATVRLCVSKGKISDTLPHGLLYRSAVTPVRTITGTSSGEARLLSGRHLGAAQLPVTVCIPAIETRCLTGAT